MRKHFFTFLLLLASVGLVAQDFTLSGELRPRLELRHGYRTLPPIDAEMAAFVSQRSRLNLLYNSDKLDVFVGFQEVRTWGGKGMFDVLPGIGLHQAYAEIPFLEKFSLKVGRQEIRYNNQRLFAINNWNQIGRTHDAAIFKFADSGWNVHLGAAFNQSTERNFGTEYHSNEYKSMNFLWFDKKLGSLDISGILVIDGYENLSSTKTYFRNTYGGILVWKPGKNSFEFYAYRQDGKHKTGQDIDAWYLSLIGRTKPADKLSLNAGLEIFSGNDKTRNESKLRIFDPLYGANHAFNGHLDYFTNIPVHTKNAGLVNPFLNLVYHLNEKVNLKADYHYFALQGKLVDENNDAIARYLGSEIDLSVQFRFSREIDLQVGYSTMFASESMEYLKNGSHKEPIHWAWVMLTVKPVFFTTKTP